MNLELKEMQNDLTHLAPMDKVDQGKEGNLSAQENQNSEKKDLTDEEMEKSLLALLEAYLTKHYDFRYNVVSSRQEYKRKSQLSYELLSDYSLNSIVRELAKQRIKISTQSLRSLIQSDFTPLYDPFIDYFNNLPAWDGTTDYIGQLAGTVKTQNNELWKGWFRKWIVAAVGCATNSKIINHTAIVFIGKQGSGKTTWMHKLLPTKLKGYFYSGVPNPKNKDAKIRLAECFLVNLDEMDSLNHTNTERLKELITTQEIRERRAYAHYDEIMPRRASFMGSVNNRQFLNDTTGNRRFLCIEVNEIEFNHNINMDKVYSQAKALLDAGFQYYFDAAEIEIVSDHNEQFQVTSYIEELVLKCFEPIDPSIAIPTHKISATDIVEYLAQKSTIVVNDANILKVGKTMKKHNFHRIKHKGNHVYALKEIITNPQIITTKS